MTKLSLRKAKKYAQVTVKEKGNSQAVELLKTFPNGKCVLLTAKKKLKNKFLITPAKHTNGCFKLDIKNGAVGMAEWIKHLLHKLEDGVEISRTHTKIQVEWWPKP